jgi:hypothetical protein
MISDPIINFLFSFKTGKEVKSVINNAIISNVTNVKQPVFIYYIYIYIYKTYPLFFCNELLSDITS